LAHCWGAAGGTAKAKEKTKRKSANDEKNGQARYPPKNAINGKGGGEKRTN